MRRDVASGLKSEPPGSGVHPTLIISRNEIVAAGVLRHFVDQTHAAFSELAPTALDRRLIELPHLLVVRAKGERHDRLLRVLDRSDVAHRVERCQSPGCCVSEVLCRGERRIDFRVH